MTGFNQGRYRYYVCGSQPYRKGLGCGKGVYVPVRLVEGEVLDGIGRLLSVCSDPKGLVSKVNRELEHLWQEFSGYDLHAERKIREIDTRIDNVRRAIEDRLQDAAWANERLGELATERRKLVQASSLAEEPPRIDTDTVRRCFRDLDHVVSHAEPPERKRFVRTLVQNVSLNPDRREITITYRLPDNFMLHDRTLQCAMNQTDPPQTR